jgi:hypothetical protein
MCGIYFHKNIMPTTSQPAYLPTAPDALVDAFGQVRAGKFAGAVSVIDWSALAAPFRRGVVWQRFHHKHWQYAALVTDQIFCGIAIVDVGWTNTAFAYVFDRQQKSCWQNFRRMAYPG